MKINFIAHRHIAERLVNEGTLGRGGAVCFISTAAGLGWETEAESIGQLLATETFEDAVTWIEDEANASRDNYMYSKQVMNTYVARAAFPFIQKGVRINAICPGPTDTPLARANEDLWLALVRTGVKPPTPPSASPRRWATRWRSSTATPRGASAA